MTDLILTQTRVVKDADTGSLFPLTLGRRRVIWRGPAGDPVFVIRDSRDIVQDRVDVHCETMCSAVVLVERSKTGPGVIPSTNHGFSRWRIYGNGLALRGFWVRSTATDENGEHMSVSHCSFYSVGVPFDSEGQNAKEHLLTHNRFDDCAVAVRSASSFQLIGGAVTRATVGVELTRAGDPVLIQWTGFEACGRLLVTSGPRTDAQPITLTGVRFAADQLHPDGAMIVLRHAGPLTILGGSFGDGAQPVPVIECAGIGEQSVTVIGAKRGAFDSVAVPFVRTKPGVRLALIEHGITHERSASATEHTATRMVG